MLIVTAINCGNLAPISDYMCNIYVNDTLIDAVSVKGHARADGWPQLLRMIADAVEERNEK